MAYKKRADQIRLAGQSKHEVRENRTGNIQTFHGALSISHGARITPVLDSS